MRKTVLYLFFAALVNGCTRDVGILPQGGYPAEVGGIIRRNCSTPGCHTSASSDVAGGINLDTWSDLFEGSNTGSPVIPFSSRFSPLMYFVNTFEDLGVTSEPTMPLNRAPLKKEDVLALKRWIDNGAPDAGGRVMWSDDPLRKKIYVANQGCDVVTVLDAATRLPIRAVEVGVKPGSDAPHQVRVSPDGKFWYVIFINSNYMQKFRTSDDSYVGDIPLTPYAAGKGDASQDAVDWNAFVISSDGRRAYCSSTANGKISIVDLEGLQFVKWIGGQRTPHGIAFHPDGDHLYVTAQTGNFVTLLDTGLTTATEIPLDGDIDYSSSLDVHEVLVSRDGGELLVTCQRSGEVRVMDIASSALKAVVKTGTFPQEIVFDELTDSYYVTCLGDTSGGGKGVITAIRDGNFTARHLQCGYQPHGIAVNRATGELLVASRNLNQEGIPPHHGSVCTGRNGFLSFVDLAGFRVKPGAYELSVDPYFISIRP